MKNDSVEAQATSFRETIQAIRNEIAKTIVGLEPVIDPLLIALMAGGHVLMEGVPGIGKTLLARTLSQVVGLKTQRIQFTPDLMPADILGSHTLIEGVNPSVQFVKGPIFTQALLADEINRCTPKTQAALLEAMQEHTVTIGGTTFKLEEPFFTMATQNPIEMEGTYPLPEAQLDRFFFKIIVPKPNMTELCEIGRRTTSSKLVKVNQVLETEKILQMQRFIREVPIPNLVEEYAARLILASSPEEDTAPQEVKDFVRHGSSPRGMQALLLGARVVALLEGRFSVASQDIQAIAMPALRHRLILNLAAEAEGMTSDSILQNLIESIPRPGGAFPKSR